MRNYTANLTPSEARKSARAYGKPIRDTYGQTVGIAYDRDVCETAAELPQGLIAIRTTNYFDQLRRLMLVSTAGFILEFTLEVAHITAKRADRRLRESLIPDNSAFVAARKRESERERDRAINMTRRVRRNPSNVVTLGL